METFPYITLGDLIVSAAIVIGFGVLVIMFRVERETRVLDLNEERSDKPLDVHIAGADWLIIASIVFAVALVIVPLLGYPGPVLALRRTIAAIADIFSVILQLGYIPAILAHYGIIGEPVPTAKRPSCTTMEGVFIAASVALASAVSVALFCVNFRVLRLP